MDGNKTVVNLSSFLKINYLPETVLSMLLLVSEITQNKETEKKYKIAFFLDTVHVFMCTYIA